MSATRAASWLRGNRVEGGQTPAIEVDAGVAKRSAVWGFLSGKVRLVSVPGLFGEGNELSSAFGSRLVTWDFR